MPKPRITVIEDDLDISSLLRFNLEKAGYEVTVYRDGLEGQTAVLRDPPDMLLLDLYLPGIEGTDICRNLRANERCANLPIIIISVRNREADIVLGLGLGADDFLCKPFGISELEARVKSVLRRYDKSARKASGSLVCCGPLVIDMDSFTAKLDGEALVLTPTEFRMLHVLASNPDRVYTRDMLKDFAISDDVIVMDHNIDVHIAALRKKLGRWRGVIETVWGVGYRFKCPKAEEEA